MPTIAGNLPEFLVQVPDALNLQDILDTCNLNAFRLRSGSGNDDESVRVRIFDDCGVAKVPIMHLVLALSTFDCRLQIWQGDSDWFGLPQLICNLLLVLRVLLEVQFSFKIG